MFCSNDRMKKVSFEGGLYDVFQKALELEAQGKSIIHMEIGRPDFDSPEIAKEGVRKALEDGIVHYTPMAGFEELRVAIAEKVKKDNNIVADPYTEIIVTAGACEALMAITLGMLNFGDEIIVPSPYFPAYEEQALIAGVNLVPIPLRMENEFVIDPDDIRNNITEKTKMILINTPHNPTGAIFGKDVLEEIAKIAIEKDLYVISDECYDEYVYEGEHISIATLPGMKERTFTVNSGSKTFSMTGWRVAYVICPKHTTKYINKVHQNLSTCATSFAQMGALVAYRDGREYIDKMVEEFKERRDLIMGHLTKIPGLKVVPPKGAFYAFPSIKEFGMEDLEFCNYILDEAGVAIVPGNSFGIYGEGFVRIAYACSKEDINEAMIRLNKAISKL